MVRSVTRCEAIRIDPGIAQILLQAQPRRRHLGNGRKSQPRQFGEPERRRIAAADQKERIAGGDLAKADERRIRVLVARLHDAHRAAPGEVDVAGEEVRGGRRRRRRRQQLDLDAFLGIETERLRGIEWRVENGAKILRELDRHDAWTRDLEARRSMAGGNERTLR